MLHVPNIRANLVSVAILGKVGVKESFESDKIIMTEDNIFVGKGFCNQGLFVLSISVLTWLIHMIYGMLDQDM